MPSELPGAAVRGLPDVDRSAKLSPPFLAVHMVEQSKLLKSRGSGSLAGEGAGVVASFVAFKAGGVG
jgi:hypothetical protein